MGLLTAEAKEYINRIKLGFVATVSPDNTPNVSPKGSVIAWDDDHLVFANLRSPQTLQNIEHVSSVEVNVVDPFSRRGYRLKGTATILRDGDEFIKIIAHYRETGVKNPIDAIVKIKLGYVKEIKSPLYDLGITEQELKEQWKKFYLD